MRTLSIDFADDGGFDLVFAYCRLTGKDLAKEIVSTGYTQLLHQALLDHLRSTAAAPQTDVERFFGSDDSAIVNSVYSVVASKKPVPASFALAMGERADDVAAAASKAAAPSKAPEAAA